MYADDVILFLSQPEKSFPALLDQIKVFGKLSGYTINWQKCEFMPLSKDLNPNFLRNLPVKVTTHVKYLGTTIPKQFDQLYTLNYRALIDKLKTDIELWRTLPMSMIGRINAIKMVTLPRFLYVFQNVPIFLSKKFFKTLDSIIMPFIWGYKPHRISKKHLCKPKELGGLMLPLFQHYYWAANARALVYWQQAYPTELNATTPSWLAIEQDVTGTSLPALLNTAKRSPGPFKGIGVIVEHSLKVWYQIKKTFNLTNTSIFAPICHNHAFRPSQSDSVFLSWRGKGLVTLKDLYIDNVFASFDQLKRKFDLQSSHFFRYLQIRNYARANISNFETYNQPDEVYSLVTKKPETKKLVSMFVNVFAAQTAPSTQYLRESWEKDIGTTISEDAWRKCLHSIYTCSVNSRHQLIQYKVIHRLHYSRVKLHSFYASTSPLCVKCKQADGTLAHMFWFCNKLGRFWHEVFHFYSEVYGYDLTPDPETGILGWSHQLDTLNRWKALSIQYGMVVAKKIILKVWNKETPPCFEAWLTEFSNILYMEKIRFELLGKSDRFHQIWQPFLDHITQLRRPS